ncbi:MAG: hypothetical protein J6S60_05800 [Oscillospiraceae bacterium]|nr:hypothetical protein [Oscillospiraceae bacterium]
MDTDIIVALIGFAGVVGAQIVISRRTTRDLLTKIEKQSEVQDVRLDAKIECMQAVTNTKIEELTREVREHNNFARRIPVLEEKISVANHRIADLESDRK